MNSTVKYRVKNKLVQAIQLASSAGVLATGLACSSISYADGLTIEEVLVTAQRRSQSTQDVPVAVTGMTGDAMEKFGFENANDIGGQVPNMQVSGPYGDVQPIFSIRGVSMSDYNSNQVSPVGVYVDEAYLPATYSHGANFFDLERLEVLRGPQGTLYGKNTTGGAVNIITRSANVDAEFGGKIKLGVANYEGRSGEVAVDVPLLPGTAAMRVAAVAKKDDGYVENRLGGPNMAQTDTMGARLGFALELGDKFSANMKITRMENDALATPVRNEPRVNTSGTLTGLGSTDDYIDYTGYNRNGRGLDFHETEANRVGPLVTSTDTATLSLQYDLDKLSIISVTAYSDATYYHDANTDGSPEGLLEIEWASDTVAFSQDIRLVSEYDGWFNFIVGAFYGSENFYTRNIYSLFEDLPDTRVVEENPDTAGLAPFLLDFGKLDQRMKTTKESRALYGQFRFDISEKLGIDLGLRYTEDRANLDYINISRLDYDNNPRGTWVPGNNTGRDEAFSPVIASPTQILSCLGDLLNCPITPQFTHGPYTLASGPALEAIEREWTGKIGVDYHFNDDLMGYANYSKGYRAGSYNGGVYYEARDVSSAYALPEFIDAYEVGVKADLWDGRARVNAAAFYYDYTDQQFVNVVGISVFLENAGGSEIAGFEAELQTKLSERLSLQIGLGYLETEYKELVLADTTTVADNTDLVDLAGNELISAPQINLNISLDWDMLKNKYGELTANVNTNFQDDQWFSAYNNDAEYGENKQEAYWLTNARLSWFSADDSYDIGLWVKNATDEEYDVYSINIQASFGFDYYMAGAPRTYGLEANYRF
ncbi:MAG: TonB-dependent receptor [Spongiibacteraceae bacterium]